MLAPPENNFLKEWEVSRSVMKTFDERLHDIRKYGFSLITAFLTASTVLFQTYTVPPSANFAGVEFREPFKAAILGVTLLLILGLYILDRNYRVVQRSVRDRLGVLEKLLNIEVTDVITQRYRLEGVQGLMTLVYIFFVAGDLLLGWVVLTSNLLWLMLAGAVVFLTIALLSLDIVVLNYRYGRLDWVLDKLECKQGDDVRIIMTNLGRKNFPKKALEKEETMWKLVSQCDSIGSTKNSNGRISAIDDSKVLRQGSLCKAFQLSSSHNFIWIMGTGIKRTPKEKLLAPGIYCLYRRVLKGGKFLAKGGEFSAEDEWKPLSRKLRIVSKPKEHPKEPLAHQVTLKTPEPTVPRIIKH